MNCYRCHATCVYKASGKFWRDTGGSKPKMQKYKCYERKQVVIGEKAGEGGGRVDLGESGGMLPTNVLRFRSIRRAFLCSLRRFFITVVKFLHKKFKILQCILPLFKILVPPAMRSLHPLTWDCMNFGLLEFRYFAHYVIGSLWN
jgi:hypothetical protein